MESIAIPMSSSSLTINMHLKPTSSNRSMFFTASTEKFLFIPPIPPEHFADIFLNFPQLEPLYRQIGTLQEIWENYSYSIGSKEARVAYATQDSVADQKREMMAKRDLLRLTGGLSRSPLHEKPVTFLGGSPYTGFMIVDRESNHILGRVAAGLGYKPNPQAYYDELNKQYPNTPCYEATPWTSDEQTNEVNDCAEIQIGDGLKTDQFTASPETFSTNYRLVVEAITHIAKHFIRQETPQNRIVPRRCTITLIDPEINTSLDPATVEIIRIKKSVLQALGWQLAGYLLPKSKDSRNYSEEIRQVLSFPL